MIQEILIDTAKVAVENSGWLGIDWVGQWQFYLFFTIIGLLFMVLYFYIRLRKENKEDPDTWKCMWKKYKNIILTHLSLYFLILFVWVKDGGYILFLPITATIQFALSLVGIDISTQVINLNNSLNTIMPKGELTFFTAFFGYFMTSIIRNYLPAIWGWMHVKWFGGKKKEIESDKENNK